MSFFIINGFLLINFVFLIGCGKKMELNKLTPEEEWVIVHKGTEQPFTGKFYKHFEQGTYVCKRCNAPLYRSEHKFDSECGWPSFDDEIPNAVKKVPDKDGVRTEIICANCGAHLGHIFYGENYTEKNVRHCVNSISLNFIPNTFGPRFQKAYFAGGCFWGVEHLFKKLRGVVSTTVGYSGGSKDNPTYEEVCFDSTGHAETVEIEFDPTLISYKDLAKYFFEIHDPTQVNRQGPDVGEQYRSVIFYIDEAQKKVAEELIETLKNKKYKVATKVEKFGKFWQAEEYHQDYYSKTGKTPYCHFYQKKFD